MNNSKKNKYIDLDYVKEFAGGDIKFLKEITLQFIKTLEETNVKLNEAMETKNLDDIYKLFHTVKSSFYYFGVTEFYGKIIDVEQMIKDKGEIALIMEKARQLNDELPFIALELKNEIKDF